MEIEEAAQLKVGDRIAQRFTHPSMPIERLGTVTATAGTLIGIRWDEGTGMPQPYDRSRPEQVAEFCRMFPPRKHNEEPNKP